MSGRSLHDALLTVLADGEVRAQLVKGAVSLSAASNDGTPPMITEPDWSMLSGLPAQRVIALSRFFARQYYRERIIRLFRYVRLLMAVTHRDPCRLLQGPAILPLLDAAVLGSPQTADSLLSLIESYLLDDDEDIQQRLPFWRELVRYQATLFRVEAAANGRAVSGSVERYPRRSTSCRMLDLEWNLPPILQQLRTADLTAPAATSRLVASRVPTTLLVAAGGHGRITTIRCDGVIRTVLASADGQRDYNELARLASISADQITGILKHLEEIGAIVQEPS